MTTADEFWAQVQVSGRDSCWPWLGSTTNYPGELTIQRGRLAFEGRVQYAYRVAWQLTNDAQIPDGLLARHTCDNPICVNPRHILIGTHADNSRDAVERGRVRTTPRYGLDHHYGSIPPETVKAAVEEYLAGDQRQEDVAQRHGVSQSTFSMWVLGRTRPDAGLASRARGKLQPCGTHAAYARHIRRGEKACEDCLAGEREHCAIQRAKRNAARPP